MCVCFKAIPNLLTRNGLKKLHFFFHKAMQYDEEHVILKEVKTALKTTGRKNIIGK